MLFFSFLKAIEKRSRKEGILRKLKDMVEVPEEPEVNSEITKSIISLKKHNFDRFASFEHFEHNLIVIFGLRKLTTLFFPETVLESCER